MVLFALLKLELDASKRSNDKSPHPDEFCLKASKTLCSK
jgi:hypothetical protein